MVTQYSSMAGCVRFGDELGAFLEGESRPFIASHALHCDSCGALLADLEVIRQVASELPLEEPSPQLWAKLRASLESEGALAPADCTRFGAEFADYLEGEARPFVAAHARECGACGALLEDLQAIRQAASELPLEDPSPRLWAKVRAGLDALGAFERAACSQFEGEIEAYLEGETRPFIDAHAGNCAACGALLEDLQAIRQAAHELPQEEPSRVVWANVRATLEAEGAFVAPVNRRWSFLAWRLTPEAVPLGVLAALVFLGAMLTLPSSDLQRPSVAPELASTAAAVLTASAAIPGDDTGLAPVVSRMESSFRANEAYMTPDLKATYEKSLVSLDGSIRECLDSLQHEPGNALARDYLLAAYTSKAEVLSSALEFEGR